MFQHVNKYFIVTRRLIITSKYVPGRQLINLLHKETKLDMTAEKQRCKSQLEICNSPWICLFPTVLKLSGDWQCSCFNLILFPSTCHVNITLTTYLQNTIQIKALLCMASRHKYQCDWWHEVNKATRGTRQTHWVVQWCICKTAMVYSKYKTAFPPYRRCCVGFRTTFVLLQMLMLAVVSHRGWFY